MAQMTEYQKDLLGSRFASECDSGAGDSVMTGKNLRAVLLGCGRLVTLATDALADGIGQQAVDPAQVQEIQERMLKNAYIRP
jgi:hypothetical protein